METLQTIAGNAQAALLVAAALLAAFGVAAATVAVALSRRANAGHTAQ